MENKVLKFCLVFIFSLQIPSIVFAHDDHVESLRGGQKENYEQAVFLKDKPYISLRNFLESLNYSIFWNEGLKSVTVTKGATKIILTINSNLVDLNGKTKIFDLKPILLDNITMIPLDFITRIFEYNITWDNTSQIIAISPISGRNLSIHDIWEKCNKQVVKIDVYNQEDKKFSSGSGLIVSTNGEIITNLHVLSGANYVEIIFSDNSTVRTSTVLSTEKLTDLALIKVDKSTPTFAVFGTSTSQQIGDQIVTISSPLGLLNTLSQGIISSLNFKDDKNKKFIQISAPIDHGSSGGALINMRGEVIGITSEGLESLANISFAIPSEAVLNFLNRPRTQKSIESITVNP